MNKSRYRRRIVQLERYARRAEKIGAFFVIHKEFSGGQPPIGTRTVLATGPNWPHCPHATVRPTSAVTAATWA